MAMSRTRKIVLILVGIVFVFVITGIIGLALLIASFTGQAPGVENNSVLVLRVAGDLPEYRPSDPAAKLFGGDDNSFARLTEQIKKAKVDKRISALLLDIDFTGIGWAKADELRDAIADFRATGKPVYAYIELGMNKEYYIATACDKIFVPPTGELLIMGFAAEVMFYKGSLDKLGIETEVVAIGKYKNAPDQYTRKEMSDPHKEVLNSLLDGLFNRYVQGVATARKKTPEEVRALIDDAPFKAKKAQEQGLIDGVSYRDQVYDELKKRLGYKDGEKIRITSENAYKDVTPESLGLNEGERIAVIYASGPINSGQSNQSPYGDQTIGSDTVVKAINDAAEDEKIKAIVLRVDSPGGSAFASDLIWHAAENAKKKKPVVISMSDVAASGGYYIACNANKIVAQPSTITGSIGVFAGKPVVKGLYNWLGITNQYVLRGKNAGMFRETEKFTPEERKKFEEMINSIYWDDFVPKVATGRNKAVKDVDAIAQGRVWLGEQGKANGLVDEYGGLDKAVDIAKGLANIPADKGVKRVIFPAPRTFLQQIFNLDGDEAEANPEIVKLRQQRAAYEALPADVRRALRFAATMDMMRNGQAMTMMPYELTIK
jgi:protease-4